MGLIRATTVYTLEAGVTARAASDMAGRCGASVSPSQVLYCTPPGRSWSGALIAVMSEALTVHTLCTGVET